MSPQTWEQSGADSSSELETVVQMEPGLEPGTGTEPTPTFEPGDFGDDAAQTFIMGAAFELRSRFTGRTATIARLQELTDHAFDDRSLAFSVLIGEPGMGKSRLLAELITRVKMMHPRTIVLSGATDESAPAYGAVARALATKFGIVIGEDVEDSRAKITAGVAEAVEGSRIAEVSHMIAHLLRVPFDDSPIVSPLLESPQRLEARMFMAVRRYFVALADKHPVLVVVENLEVAGPESINLLHYLAAGLQDQRVSIVGTATGAVYNRHSSFGDGEVAPVRLDIGAMSPAESEELLRELLKLLPSIPPVLVAHVRTMGGSPRSIHELVRLLFETNCIVRQGIIWRLDADTFGNMVLPTTYDDIVSGRMRVMDELDRRVIEMAAVVGETAWLDAILAVERGSTAGTDPDGPTLAQIAASGDQSRLALVAAVNRLVEREWLVEIPGSSIAGEKELRFAYPNLWNLVYKQADDARKRGYHAIVARWLELHPSGRGPSTQEEVARHLALGGEAREAAIRYRRAADVARDQYANDKAIRLYDRAIACVGSDPTGDLAARLHLWHDLGSVYELIGDFEAALGAFERMLRLSWVAASKTKAAVAFNKMGRVWRRKGDLKLALEYLERGLELFRSAGDERGIATSLDDIGKSLQMLGRYDDAHNKITEALARRSKTQDKRSIAMSLSRLGEIQQDRGQYESAYTCHKEALELRKSTGDRWGQAVSQNNLAALAFELGDFADARAGWLAALPEAEGIGALPLASLILSNLGELALVEGKLEEARSRLDNALEIIEDIEDRGLESEVCRHLAALEKAQGRTGAARELAERALAVAQRAGLREKEAQAFLTLGDVLATTLHDSGEANGVKDAGDAFGKAIEVLRQIGNDAQLGKALFEFGRFQAECGHLAEGKDMLRDSIMVFTRLGLSRPAGDAEKLLASLS